jgi:hypothetical protein
VGARDPALRSQHGTGLPRDGDPSLRGGLPIRRHAFSLRPLQHAREVRDASSKGARRRRRKSRDRTLRAHHPRRRGAPRARGSSRRRSSHSES